MANELVPGHFSSSYYPVFNTKTWNRMFEDFEKSFSDLSVFEKEVFGSGNSPPYDILSILDENGRETGMEINFTVADYKKDDIKIEVDNDVLSLSMDKSSMDKSSDEQKNKKVYLYRGIKRSKWQVSYKLGPNVDKEKIDAKLENGTLKISIPFLKEEEIKKVKLIEIK